MALKIEMFRCLSAVARSGNLKDGAEFLSKTPSAVSMSLKQLEDHLGQNLFEKDRKNKLTPVGAFVLEQAERELQHFDMTVRAIHDYAYARKGHVRLAVVPSVAGTVMPRYYAENRDALASIHLEVRDMDSASVLQELYWGRVDIGIATFRDSSMGLSSTLLMSDRFGVVAAPDHPIAAQTGPVDWSDLRPDQLIANSLSANIANPQCRDLHARANLSAHNMTSILAMVRANIGVTILPEMAVWPFQPDTLVFRHLNDPTAKRQIHLLRQSETAQSPAEEMVANGIAATVRSISFDQGRSN